jgi:hypothetical protein
VAELEIDVKTKSITRLKRKAAVCGIVSIFFKVLLFVSFISFFVLFCLICSNHLNLQFFFLFSFFLMAFNFIMASVFDELEMNTNSAIHQRLIPLHVFLKWKEIPQEDIDKIIAELGE